MISSVFQCVDATALAGLFELFAHHIGCVILNACHSDLQAKAIAQHIPHVIGMKQEIGDRAALEFAIGFYDALGAGQPIEFAYKLGCSEIRMSGIPEELTPTLQPAPLTTQNPSPISISPVPQPLTSAQKRRLEQRQQTLETDYNLRDQKLKEIRKAIAIATGATSKFELQQQIQEEEASLTTLADELESIEASLSS